MKVFISTDNKKIMIDYLNDVPVLRFWEKDGIWFHAFSEQKVGIQEMLKIGVILFEDAPEDWKKENPQFKQILHGELECQEQLKN
jgi:hypothetical protein